MLDKDIIEPVNGPSRWISSIVPIIKGNGEIRICIDMRRANEAILRENHPLPTMDYLLPQCEGVLIFIDDIVIFGEDDIQHETRLKNIKQILKTYNVLLNESKCNCKQTSIDFLEHRLTENGRKPLDNHIKSIKSFRAPKTVEEVQSLLRTVNFVGKWIPHLAPITEPIRTLLRKKLGKKTSIVLLWKKSQVTPLTS